MSGTFDVAERLAWLRRATPALRLYALLDGAQYQQLRGHAWPARPTQAALFDGTPDAALAHAGPWLIDIEEAGAGVMAELVELERAAPALSWLIAPQDLRGLAQLLRLQLDVRLPDGRTALLRFWDARVLATLAEILEPAQRAAFFGPIHEWHLLRDGQRVWIGRPCADA